MRISRRQFLGWGLFSGIVLATPAFGQPKPCWELNPNNPNWCPPPSPPPEAPPFRSGTRKLLLLI